VCNFHVNFSLCNCILVVMGNIEGLVSVESFYIFAGKIVSM
jgi:hypothetical protein